MSNNNNSKKKQEEKHLKTLREFLAIPTNKTCFDCNQRGPTYVNTTIGSFVCISCSGKLRGLTPPHRVKSISMASFTAEEIEFLRNRGNEYCRIVWMSHYNIVDLVAETKDEQRFKDHLVAKYERKRWYTDPSSLADRLSITKTNGTNGEMPSPNQNHAPVVSTSSPVARPTASSVPSMSISSVPLSKTSDLLADLDFFTPTTAMANAASAFPSPRKNPSPMPQSISQPSFANFQNADFFFPETSPQKVAPAPAVTHHNQSGAVNGITSPLKAGVAAAAATAAVNATHVVPPEDRYSALKDLDALFTTTQTAPASEPAPSNWAPSWASGPSQTALPNHSEIAFANSMEAPSGWQSAFQPSNNSSNPFLASTQSGTQGGHYCQPALPWANFSSSPSSAIQNTALGSVFPTSAAPGSQFGLGFAGHSNPMGVAATLSTSQSLDLSPKTWGTSSGMNPFMNTTGFNQGRSHNPFL